MSLWIVLVCTYIHTYSKTFALKDRLIIFVNFLFIETIQLFIKEIYQIYVKPQIVYNKHSLVCCFSANKYHCIFFYIHIGTHMYHIHI